MNRGDAIYYDPWCSPISPRAPTNITVLSEEKPGQVVGVNGLSYNNKGFKVWDGEKLVETFLRLGDLSNVFDGSLNAPDNQTARVIEGVVIDLKYEGESKICENGTGSVCEHDVNMRATAQKGDLSTTHFDDARPIYNLPLSGQALFVQ